SFVRDLIPGAILTFGIDSMIAVIRVFGLDLDTSAKLAEQAMSIGMVVVVGSIVGGIIYASINRLKRDAVTISAILGVALGTAMALIVAGKNITATANPIASLLWVMVLYTLWGLALGWAYHQLQTIGTRPIASDTESKLQTIDRRKFLVQIGGATATLTVVGAGLGALLQPEIDTSDAFEVNTTGETITSTADTTIPTTSVVSEVIPNLTTPIDTRPEITPIDEHYRIDISARPPLVDAESYRLKVHGMVEAPLEI
ncbi:MAG TPA: hypothetical protein PLZ51_27805, partial [Aggregatilineales bacterium]|nr:hypothetical protein [Aggregatilineales bacterium]